MTPSDQPVLEILGKRYVTTILHQLDEPRSVRDLCERVEVPVATCYRRMAELVDAGLVQHFERELADKQRRRSTYRRQLDAITVDFTTDVPVVDITHRSEDGHELDPRWRR
jgi:predicted transcriptional regulator